MYEQVTQLMIPIKLSLKQAQSTLGNCLTKQLQPRGLLLRTEHTSAQPQKGRAPSVTALPSKHSPVASCCVPNALLASVPCITASKHTCSPGVAHARGAKLACPHAGAAHHQPHLRRLASAESVPRAEGMPARWWWWWWWPPRPSAPGT